MNPHERHLAGVTAAAIIVIVGLAFVPFEILVTVVGPILVLSTIASVVMLSRAVSRPLSPLDEELDRLDQERDREARAKARRLAHARAREASPFDNGGGGWRR